MLNVARSAASATSPTHGNSFTSMGGIDYIIGSIFIVLGILVYFAFQRKSKAKYEAYKKSQLDLYNKNRGTKVSDYSRTSLYVPFWDKAKFTAPVMISLLFVIVGLFWIIWTATGTPMTTL